MAIKHRSEINIKVGLDENRVPEELKWSADDGAITDMESKALLLSVWDSKEKDTYKINLWTKEMPINEILSLGPGSIIEVGHLVDEPVELLVNDKLIARGDVVVVDEKFGLRITEIVSPRERIESLR